MALTAIKKYLDRFHVAPNLIDYDSTCATFSWEAAERELERSPEYRGLNIAYHCVDRHANSPRRGHLALRWLSKSGEAREVTYDGLRRLTNRFANVLRELGVGQGARVFALTGRIPELYTAALGTLKNGSVFCRQGSRKDSISKDFPGSKKGEGQNLSQNLRSGDPLDSLVDPFPRRAIPRTHRYA